MKINNNIHACIYNCIIFTGTVNGRAGRQAGSDEGLNSNDIAMAAVPKSKRPVLLSKLEGHTGAINRAVIVKNEDAVITASDDK